ncbi:MAG: hypothetical protein ABIP85_26200 [Chthoniobacteraceae bacterium]
MKIPLMKHIALLTLVTLFLGSSAFSQDTPKFLRAGIVGLDTSHVPGFTSIFNKAKDPELASIRIVAGYPGGTDMPASKNRVATLT